MKRLLLIAALLGASLFGATGTAYASHAPSDLEIVVTSVHLNNKDGSAVVRVKVTCAFGSDTDNYAVQPFLILSNQIAYTATNGRRHRCTGTWQRYLFVLVHSEGMPLLSKGTKTVAAVDYQLYPDYTGCEGHGCDVYQFGSHFQTVQVHGLPPILSEASPWYSATPH